MSLARLFAQLLAQRSRFCLLSLVSVLGCTSVSPLSSTALSTHQARREALIEALAEHPTYLKLSGWSLGEPLLLSPQLRQERAAQTLLGNTQERSPHGDLTLIINAMAHSYPELTSNKGSDKDLGKTSLERVDEGVWCQHPTLARFISREAPSYGVTLPQAPVCPAFEAWARLDQLKGLELLMATPSTYEPVSSFGHISLRLRFEERDDSPQDLVYEASALVEPHDHPALYAIKGLLGGYPLIFEPRTLKYVIELNSGEQGRTLLRYPLKLNQIERRAVLQRLWELERRAYLPYRFTTQNCAYYVIWLLETALFDVREELTLSGLLIAPSETLDLLEERGLIERHPRPLRAFYQEIEGWRREQVLVAKTLTSHQLLSSELSVLISDPQRFVSEVQRAMERPLKRPASDMSQATSQATSQELSQHLLTLALFELKVRRRQLEIEQRHEERTRELIVSRTQLREVPSLEEGISLRQQYHQDEDLTRKLAFAEHMKERAERLTHHERVNQDPLLKQQRQRVKRARDAFFTLTRGYARLKNTHHQLKLSSLLFSQPSSQPLTQTRLQPELTPRWESHSGFRYTSISVMSAPFNTHQQTKDVLNLSIKRALWREQLGASRPYGVGPQRSLTLFRSELVARWREGSWQPRFPGVDIRLIEFTSMSEALSPQEALEATLPSGGPAWGWRVTSDLRTMGEASHLDLALGLGFTGLHPQLSRWQLSLFTELSPRLARQPWLTTGSALIRAPERYSSTGTLSAPQAQRAGLSTALFIELSARLGHTGKLALKGRYEQGLLHGARYDSLSVLEGGVHLELPLSQRERVRLNAELRTLCLERCALTFEVGAAW